MTLPRNPWVFGEGVSHPLCRYSCQHAHFSAVHHALPYSFTPLRTLPYHTSQGGIRRVGTLLESHEFLAPYHSTSELLRFLYRMAASKPTSWLSEQYDNL